MIACDGLDVYIGSNIRIRLKEKVKIAYLVFFNLFVFVEWLKQQSHQVHFTFIINAIREKAFQLYIQDMFDPEMYIV